MVTEQRRRGRVSEAAALQLASRLTDRDRRIALDCFEHRVLTSEQLQRLHFAGARTARARLEQLYLLQVLDRFRPPWPQGTGSAPYHWVLDQAGAHIVAEQLGLEPKELRWRREAAIALAGSSKLRHQIEVNEFFTQLGHEARQAGGNLREWWGERRALEVLDGIVAPDGYGRLAVPCQPELSFLLELDRATEDHARLRQKAKRYAKALPRSDLSAEDPIVLVAVPTAVRARALEEALASSSVPIAAVPWTAQGSARTALLQANARLRRDAGAARSPLERAGDAREAIDPMTPAPPPAPYI
jgi:hypothetical protein